MPEKIFLLNSLTEVFSPSDLNKEKLKVCPKTLWSNSSLFSQDLLIITQNKQVKEWLLRQSAQSFGLSPFAPSQCKLSDQAVRELITQVEGFHDRFSLNNQEGKQQLLFSADLRLIVYKYLEERIKSKDQDFEAIANYIQYNATTQNSSSARKLQSSRLFALATSTANLIEEYSMRYDDLIATWQLNQQYLKDNINEKWQQRLWFDLFGRDESQHGGALAPFALVSDVIRYILKHNLAYKGALKRIIIIGTPFLNALTHRLFMHFSQYLELNIFAYAALDLSTTTNQRNFNKQYGGALLEYRDYLDQYGYAYQSLVQPVITGSLRSLRNTLLANQEADPAMPLEGLKLIACSDPLREVEALRDLLLNKLAADPSLRLQDICIVMSDPALYTPHIRNTFTMPLQGRQIPVYFDEVLAGATVSAIDQAILDMLSLSGTRFKQSQIFSLLSNSAILERLELSEQEKRIWLNFAQQHHVNWGFIAEQREREVAGYAAGDASNAFTWLRAFIYYLNEYVNGYVDINGEELELSSSEADVIGLFIHFVHQLYDTFYLLTSERHSLEGWIEYLEPAIAKFLPGIEAQQGRVRIFRSISEIARTLDNLNYHLFEDNQVAFPVVQQLIEESLEREFEGSVESGGQQGILCAPVSAVRILPFKIIAFLGMGQSQYPSDGEHSRGGYDLKQLLEESGNSSFASTFIMKASNNERASFFETCMAASEELYIFYQAIERLTGERLEPSSVIYDLLQRLNHPLVAAVPWHRVNNNDWHIHYPLHPFDFSLFQNHTTQSYYPYAHEYAKAFYLSSNQEKESEKNISLNTFEQIIELSLDDLVNFIWSPLDATLSASAGVEKQWDALDEDLEVFGVKSFVLQKMHARLLKWQLKQLDTPDLVEAVWQDAIERDELLNISYMQQAHEQFGQRANIALEALRQESTLLDLEKSPSYSFELALTKQGQRATRREEASYIIKVESSDLYRFKQEPHKKAYVVLPYRVNKEQGLHSYDYKHRIKGRLLNHIFKQMGWQDRVVSYLAEYRQKEGQLLPECTVHRYEELESKLEQNIVLETLQLYQAALERPLFADRAIWTYLRDAKPGLTKQSYAKVFSEKLIDNEERMRTLELLGFTRSELEQRALEDDHFERLEQLWRYFMIE